MIKTGGLPGVLRMTLTAVSSDLAVEFVGWCAVTRLALLAHGTAQKFM
jgi:hypothetical protein